jgi:hypothetical protein
MSEFPDAALQFDFTTNNALNEQYGNNPNCLFLTRSAQTKASGYLNNLGFLQFAETANTPRFEYTNGACRGLRLDGYVTVTNLLGNTIVFGTSGTTFNWSQSNISGAGTANATGPDNTTSAVTFTATAANGTVSQSRGAVGVGGRVFSVWLRRPSGGGSGNIQITYNTAGTWTTVSVTDSWQRFSVVATSGSAVPGIRIVTSGDKVEAYAPMLQVYSSTFYKSAGPEVISLANNTTALGDAPQIKLPASSNAAVGASVFVEFEQSDRYGIANGSQTYITFDDGNDSYISYTQTRSDESVLGDSWAAEVSSSSTAYLSTSGDSDTSEQLNRVCLAIQNGSARLVRNGETLLDLVDSNIVFPNWESQVVSMNCAWTYIRKIAVFEGMKTVAQMEAMTSW